MRYHVILGLMLNLLLTLAATLGLPLHAQAQADTGIQGIDTALAASPPANGLHQKAQKKPETRAQALAALKSQSDESRFNAIVWLAEFGAMPDADRVAERLFDDNPQVRAVAADTLWLIWSRSGDKTIDALYQQGVRHMGANQLQTAVSLFSDIIRKKPGFAEAWNKRATVYFMLGEFEKSLKDCDEVMKRNSNHFGALSGYGQIHMQLGDFERAIVYFERALKVNPNLPGTTETIEQLRGKLEEKRRKTI